MKERNDAYPDDLCPDQFIEAITTQMMWLLCNYGFVVEARKQDGEPYPPTTLQCLLSGILRYMREHHGDTPDFLSKKDARFWNL